MNEKIEKLYTLLQTTPLKAKLTLAALFLVVLALPLTLSVSQQQQNLTQNAAGVVNTGCQPGAENNVGNAIYGCHLINGQGVWDNISHVASPVPCPYGVANTGKDKFGANDYTCAPAPSTAPAKTAPVIPDTPAADSGDTTVPLVKDLGIVDKTLDSTSPSPSPSPDSGWDTSACGAQVPSDYWVKVMDQAQKEHPDKRLDSQSTSGPWDSLTPGEWQAAAQNAGYDTATLVQSGMMGNPYSPSDNNGYATSSNPLMQSYTNCVQVTDDFGTTTNQKVICYKDGVEKASQDVDFSAPGYNPDAIKASVLGSQCVPGGYFPSSEVATGSNVNSQNLETTNTGNKKTTLGLNIGLSGFDSSSHVKTSVKDFLVQLLDQQNRVVASKNTPLNFNRQTNSFQGNVDLIGLSQKVEGLKVAVNTPGYFQASTKTVLPISADGTNKINLPDLPAGDITGTGVVSPNILDYNVFVSCSVFSKDSGSACKDKSGQSLKPSADLNGDGIVNQDDYTILLKSWQLLNR